MTDDEIFDRLVRADEKGKGLKLTASEVADLVEMICEIDLQRYLDQVLAAHIIAELSGETPNVVN